MEPIASPFWGPGLGDQPNPEVLFRETVGTADAACSAIAERIASLELQVKETRTIRDGTVEEEIIDDNVLAELIHDPHPDRSMSELLWLTGFSLAVCGKAYWLKVSNDLNLPSRLDWIIPTKVIPKVELGAITGYFVMNQTGQIEELKREWVIRFCRPDPMNPWDGRGLLGPQAIQLDAQKFTHQHLRRHMETDATPKAVIKALEGTTGDWTPTQKERFATLWEQMYNSRRGTHNGIPAIIPTGFDIVQLAMISGADVTPLLDHRRDDVLMATGVPRSVLGQVVSGDRSSAETNDYSFDKHRVASFARIIEESLTRQLAVDFDPSLTICFAPFIAPDKEFDLKQQVSDLEHAVRPINEIRVARGEDEVEWGDQPTITTKIKVYDPSAPEPVVVDPQAAPTDDDDQIQRLAASRRRHKRRLRSA
jgi:hypothetical protein